MPGSVGSKWMDEDWQIADTIDRKRFPCEVVQLANAELARRHQWIGSDTSQAMVVSHISFSRNCQERLFAW